MSDDLKFPREAYHDPSDGMYKLPGPAPAEGEFAEDQRLGMFLPRPKVKAIRYMDFDFNYRLEVNETLQEIETAIAEAKANPSGAMIAFTDPTFGTPIGVTREHLQRVCAVIDGWKDIEEVEMQLRAASYAKERAKAQASGVEVATMQPLAKHPALSRKR